MVALTGNPFPYPFEDQTSEMTLYFWFLLVNELTEKPDEVSWVMFCVVCFFICFLGTCCG